MFCFMMMLTLEMTFEGLETFVGWWRSRSSCTYAIHLLFDVVEGRVQGDVVTVLKSILNL